jgi:hypothetical protein
MKRLFDLMFALLLLTVLCSVLLIVSILVYFKLGSSIVFKQKRPGLHEKIFSIYKFRTMTDAKIRVVCGHNASAGDQHILMIDAINKLPLHVRDQCQFIFLLTYGGDADKICQLLKKQSFESVSLTEMLIGQELYDFIA